MPARFERRSFDEGCRLWIRRYRSLRNIPHWHYEPELIACQQGGASVTLNGHQYTLHAEECLLCASERVHSVSSGEDAMLTVVQFDPQMLHGQELCEPQFPDRYHLIERLELIDAEYRARAPYYADKINALFACAIIDVARKEPLRPCTNQETRTARRYRELLTHMEERTEEITFAEAAAYMEMSAAYFSRYFKRMAGMTFSRYLNMVRVDRAVRLLREHPAIAMTDLMQSCGFYTLRNLNRVFKEITGFSPTRLPLDYTLDIRSMMMDNPAFDPTLSTSVELD